MNDRPPVASNDGPDFICADCDAGVFQMGRDWCPVDRRCETCRTIARIGRSDPDVARELRRLFDW